MVEAALAAPEPASKRALIVNRRSDPGPQGAPLLRLVQYVADLNAWRDDAHLAAWRPQAVSGPAWEAFTLLWRGEAHTPAELANKLDFRGLAEDDYAAALDELIAPGWIAPQGSSFELTAAGSALRQQVEDETDRLYDAPWAALSPAELAELGTLLAALIEAVRALAPAPEQG